MGHRCDLKNFAIRDEKHGLSGSNDKSGRAIEFSFVSRVAVRNTEELEVDWSTLKQSCKVGVAVGLAYLLTYGERSQYALYAVLTASLVVGENLGEDLNLSIVRLVGTVIGAGVGVCTLYIGGINLVSLVVSIIVAGLVSKLIKLEQVNRVALAVCVVTLLLHQDGSSAYGIYRFINTIIGALIGFGVSLLLWPIRAEAAAAQTIDRLVELSAGVLSRLASNQNSVFDLGTSVEAQQLAKVFKVIRDVHREGHVIKGTDAAIGARAILGGQVGLGSLAVAAACERLAGDPAINSFLAAVRVCAGQLADRAKTSAQPAATGEGAAPHPVPFPEVPELIGQTKADPVYETLIAGLVMELRIIAAALSLLERLKAVSNSVARR